MACPAILFLWLFDQEPDQSLQVHGPSFYQEKHTGLILIPEDQGVHQDSQAGKDTACISCYLKKYLNVLQFVT